MPWFKVDDKLHDHRKARGAGVQAMGLWLLAGSWCADNLSDGFVPASVAIRWDRNYMKLAGSLVAAGLWDEDEQEGERGWRFHDWERFQPTRAQVEGEREAARERMSRRRSLDVRANTDGTSGRVRIPRPDPTRWTPPSPPRGERRGAVPDVSDLGLAVPAHLITPMPETLRRNGRD